MSNGDSWAEGQIPLGCTAGCLRHGNRVRFCPSANQQPVSTSWCRLRKAPLIFEVVLCDGSSQQQLPLLQTMNSPRAGPMVGQTLQQAPEQYRCSAQDRGNVVAEGFPPANLTA